MAEAKVVIVGGGISGLATSYFLAQSGIPFLLIEKSGRLGGLIKTDLIQGCQLEAGPDSYLSAKPALTDLAARLGLQEQIIDSNDQARKVFLVRNQRLIPMPEGMVMMAPSRLRPVFESDLFSGSTKLRLLLECFRKPLTRSSDITVAQLVTDHFGSEVLDFVAEPLLTGVYGGDAGNLSARSVLPRFLNYEERYGSLIRGVRRERRPERAGSLFKSFRSGMQTATDALADALAPSQRIVNSAVTSVERSNGYWRVTLAGGFVDAQEVVIACPAWCAARLLEKTFVALAADLGAIPYSSAILITFVYSRDTMQRSLDGFGFLVPKHERRTVAAATWISTKFPSRVPPDFAAIRAFIVGSQARELMNSPEAELLELARADVERFMNFRSEPMFSTVYRWPDSMPQYVVGHEQRQRTIMHAIGDVPGMHLVGNSYDGVGIPDCIRLARAVAERIRGRVN